MCSLWFPGQVSNRCALITILHSKLESTHLLTCQMPQTYSAGGREASEKTLFPSNNIDHTAPHIRHTFKACYFLAAMCGEDGDQDNCLLFCVWLWFHPPTWTVLYENFRVLSKETAKYGILLNNKNIGKHMYFFLNSFYRENGRTPRSTGLGEMVSLGLNYMVMWSQNIWIRHYFYRAMINGP